MYAYLSKYYNQIFGFPSEMSSFLSTYKVHKGYAIDLGCGTGRLTKVIHDLDMNVLGIDLDQHMIEVAKKNYPHLHFCVENMIDSLKKEKSYDLITCFGNTIVHINPKALNEFFEYAFHRLSDHGYLIIQTLNYEEIMKNRPKELIPLDNDYLKFNRYYEYVDNYINFSTRLEVEGHVFEGSTQIYPYLTHDFVQYAKIHRMEVVTYGGLNFQQVSHASQHVYYVFKKLINKSKMK